MKRILIGALVFMPICAYGAQPASLADAINLARVSCGGISTKMAHMKTMAGINTAITGVGTGLGVGATAVGLVKSDNDKTVDELNRMIERYKTAQAKVDNSHLGSVYLDHDALRNQLKNFAPVQSPQEVKNDISGYYSTQIDQLENLRDMGIEKSKTLGNTRTGLMAANTATNIAGAVIAANNTVDTDLKTKISQCLAAVDTLRNAKMQAHINGTPDTEIARVDKIINACSKYEYAALDKIDNRAKGAGISGGIGAVASIGGTITSATANSETTRSGDATREKNLNTASNVLAGVASAASLGATVFNATQIKAIKNISEIADECEGVLR